VAQELRPTLGRIELRGETRLFGDGQEAAESLQMESHVGEDATACPDGSTNGFLGLQLQGLEPVRRDRNAQWQHPIRIEERIG